MVLDLRSAQFFTVPITVRFKRFYCRCDTVRSGGCLSLRRNFMPHSWRSIWSTLGRLCMRDQDNKEDKAGKREMALGRTWGPEWHVMSWFSSVCGRLRLKCDGTRAETRFRLSLKRTSPFKSAGASVLSTTGSRGVRISGSNAGYTMFRGSVKGTGYPLQSPVSLSFPSSTLPCTITFQLDSTYIRPSDFAVFSDTSLFCSCPSRFLP